MPFEIPAPSQTFEVALDDGAAIRVRRHGNPDGARLLVTHGNGFAADAYYLYWRQFLENFDVVVFDFRNHGQSQAWQTTAGFLEQQDLSAVLDWLTTAKGPTTIALLGVSMGGAAAVNVAGSTAPVIRSCIPLVNAISIVPPAPAQAAHADGSVHNGLGDVEFAAVQRDERGQGRWAVGH